MINENQIMIQLLKSIKKTKNEFWCKKLEHLHNSNIHIAVMVEPYLSKIMSGEKTIESRLTQKKSTPWRQVIKGDVIVLKKSGGAFCAIFEAGEVISKEIATPDQLSNLRTEFNDKLCIEDEWWIKKAKAKYATLVFINNLQEFEPFEMKCKNRQSWIVLNSISIDLKNRDREGLATVDRLSTVSVYCVSGRIGSGKTTIGKLWADKINGKHCSISDFLKAQLLKKGVDKPSREELQELGAQYIEKGWVSFANQIIEYVGFDKERPLVIDGVRHKNFLDSIRILCYPVPVYEIVLDGNEKTLCEHINSRGAETFDESHASEGNISELLLSADVAICIDDKEISEVVTELEYKLSNMKNSKNPSDSTLSMSILREYIDYFNEVRGWKKYHNAKDLAISINLESSELLEIFQWMDRKQIPDRDRMSRIKEELADILIYSIDFANTYGIDIMQIVLNKLKINNMKYPVNLDKY